MEELLVDIKEKLQNNVYKNEEHIRLSLVCRLLLALGWNIWNPEEVNTEFLPIPREDKTRVDIALFAKGAIPSIFIETKALGKLAASLSEVERQVRDYNRNNTALFSVITDGRIWRFYFSQTGGEFYEKCFKACDLVNDDLDSLEEIFLLFLEKDNLLSGRAEDEARQYLQLTKLEKAVQDSLHQAKLMTLDSPFPTLPQAVAELVSQKGFDISKTKATELLKKQSKQDFSVRNFRERPIEQSGVYPDSLPVNSKIPSLNLESPGDLRFTKVEGKIGGQKATNWKKLICEGFRLAIKKNHNISELDRELIVNIKEGEYKKGLPPSKRGGYAYVSDLDISVQGLDANNSLKTLLQIAKILECQLELTITWNDKSPRAGEQATIRWP